MLRRSSAIKSNCLIKDQNNSTKGEQSAEFLPDNFQPVKNKKLLPQKKLNQKSKNPYCSIQECPTIFLTTQQMKGNFLSLLINLQKQYQSYGAVKLVSSDDWNPPFTFKYIDHGLTTRNQILQDLKYGKPFQQNIEAHTLQSFKTMAKEFEDKYQHFTKTDGSQFQKNEFQFWSLVCNPKYEQIQVQVQYAADIPTSKYCSAFPVAKQSSSTDSNFNYHDSYFNLNNTFKDSDSILKVCQLSNAKISGITQPWVYIGMKFSSFCWHVQDLHMNSMNYNHKGSTKTWYIIPESDKEKMDEYILNQYKHISKGKQQFLHRMTLMINPLDLKKHGIKVYKINQSKKCYVVTFPKAYHCGFSQGFNVGQAVNYSTIESIPYLIKATEEYKKMNGKKYSVFPVQWIIDENYNQLSKSQRSSEWRKIITKQYLKYVEQELLLIKAIVKKKKNITCHLIDLKKIKYHKNPCARCMHYIYFSMLRCKKCQKVYCLDHKFDCCQDQYELVIRKPQNQRFSLIKLLGLQV